MEESKPMLHEFDPVIYPRKLWIAVSKDKFKNILKDVCEFPDSCDAFIENAFDYRNNKGGILIRFENIDALNYGNIAHESSHAAMEIIDFISGKVDLRNQEYFSYLCGWIAKCCGEVKEYYLNQESDGRSKDQN